ncbi:alpha-L-arabinofuranosidase C-terminal domain-containing protein [Pedobacter insulae]|uniref:non-reducing end alpha-L-arabinofuranosidase n=1 Tax=Pedobacter insulae TaxID=414048 RepID=A0A1I2ZA15_9SPHI|nr:alpha-L-arabinofuranosidase C-terminal domain-containing protein [Pedobacter insulae]SFH34425.1 Carbohydrate binding domain-containing protein [Pedobacter insulae]
MKRLFVGIWLLFLLFDQQTVLASIKPDSVYLFSYTTTKNGHRNGLHFAWSNNRSTWFMIGNEYGFLKSDYGRWGAEKRMYKPFLLKSPDGDWHCIWSVNDRDNSFAITTSRDLINWKPQHYPKIINATNLLNPVLAHNRKTGEYTVSFASSNEKYLQLRSKDLKTYSDATAITRSQFIDPTVSIHIAGSPVNGQVHRVAWHTVDDLIKAYEHKQYQDQLNNESTAQDPHRFANLKEVNTTITLHPNRTKQISDMLVGVFFEDINYAADGGLYAELIQNRDFEYALSDKEGYDKTWTSKHSWLIKGDQTSFTVDSVNPLHVNNPHYAVLTVKQGETTLSNQGFDGITLKKGEKYNLSLFTKTLAGKVNRISARLVANDGKILAQAILKLGHTNWKQVNASLLPNDNANNASLELTPMGNGTLAMDMISLFPTNTFKDRKNGLRADLAQTVAAINPRFVRFPGGCVAHGDGIHNIYRWKNTIGPLESRVPQRNLWGYHQTAGLGYFEYFQFCEDIGAAPLPVLAAGVPCQNSATGGAGQQGGIPMEEMGAYIQDIFDLIEWANGGVNTPWGKKRAEAGHPKPFNLKYIGIGNEDLISDIFKERFTLIFNAVRKKHPEITIIGTVGPFSEGSDYVAGWKLADQLEVPMVDEHYYQNTGWFIHNQDYYDRYDRSKSKVYLGEYAAFLPGRPNNIETALCEALYLTALERNGDIVHMSSYAPMLAKEGHTQWNPNLIYFNNSEVKPTTGYQVQKLYGQNAGTTYIDASITVSSNQNAVKNRIAHSFVVDPFTKDLIVKLVNLLPIAVNSKIDLNGILPTSVKAVKTTLTGNAADKNVEPLYADQVVSEKFDLQLAAYSFTIIRIKTQKE